MSILFTEKYLHTAFIIVFVLAVSLFSTTICPSAFPAISIVANFPSDFAFEATCMYAPFNSLIFVSTFSAIKSITLSGTGSLFASLLFLKIAVLISIVGCCMSAVIPLPNLEVIRFSRFTKSFGGLSEVKTICFPDK